MNKVFYHNKSSIKNIVRYYFLALVPLIIYGVYKNGFLLYSKGLISILAVFRPLLFVLIPLAVSLTINLIKSKKVLLDFQVFSWASIGLFCPPQTSILSYTIIIVIGCTICSFFPPKINYSIITRLIIVIILMLLSKYTYLNYLEMQTEYSFSFIDLLWGRSIGGICSTSAIYGVVCYIFLSFSDYYKKKIPVISGLIYLVLIFLEWLITKDLSLSFTNCVGTILAFVIIATIPIYSPYTLKGQVIYSVLLGILTFILNMVFPFEGVFIAILILSSVSFLFDKLINSFRST